MDLRLVAGRARLRHDPRARDRRQRQPGSARRRHRRSSVVAGRCPCPSLWSASTVPAVPDVGRPEPGRARPEVPQRRRRLRQGRALLQGRRQQRHARRQPVDDHRHAARARRPSATKRRPAGSRCSSTRRSRSPRTRPTSCRITPTSATTRRLGGYFSTLGVDRRRCTRRRAAPSAATASSCTARRASRPRRSTRPTTGSTSSSTARPDTTGAGDCRRGRDADRQLDRRRSRGRPTSRRRRASTTRPTATFPPALTLHASRIRRSSRRTACGSPGCARTRTYFFRVRSTDRAGNAGTWPPAGPAAAGPGGTPAPRELHDAEPDAARHDDGRLQRRHLDAAPTSPRAGDGELDALAGARAAEFSGTTLPAGWSTSIWSPGGSAVVDGGRLTVDGARVAASTRRRRRQPGADSLEFVATFTGDPYPALGPRADAGVVIRAAGAVQHLLDRRRRHASTSGGSLGVRTSIGDGSGDVDESRPRLLQRAAPLPHRLAAAAVTYSVDGVQVASHASRSRRRCVRSRPATSTPSAAPSSSTGFACRRIRPPGSFLSRVFDARRRRLAEIKWTAATPAGTSLAICGRGLTPFPTARGPFVPVAAPGALGLHSRYVQYRADLASNDPSRTPSLADIVIAGHVPVAPPPTPVTISIGDVTLAEGNTGPTMFAFPVTLSAATDHAVTVGFSTLDGTATAANGDYVAKAGEVTIPRARPGTGSWSMSTATHSTRTTRRSASR